MGVFGIQDWFSVPCNRSHEHVETHDTSPGQIGFIAPVGKGLGQQEKGGKQGGKSKGKGKMHKGLRSQTERGEQRRFGGYRNRYLRISHKEAQC